MKPITKLLRQLRELQDQPCYVHIHSKYIKHVLPVDEVSQLSVNFEDPALNHFQAVQKPKKPMFSTSAIYIIDFTLGDVESIVTRDSGYVEVHLKAKRSVNDNVYQWIESVKIRLANLELEAAMHGLLSSGILPVMHGEFNAKDYGLNMPTYWTAAEVQQLFDDRLAVWMHHAEYNALIAIADRMLEVVWHDKHGAWVYQSEDNGWCVDYVRAVRGWLDCNRFVSEQIAGGLI